MVLSPPAVLLGILLLLQLTGGKEEANAHRGRPAQPGGLLRAARSWLQRPPPAAGRHRASGGPRAAARHFPPPSQARAPPAIGRRHHVFPAHSGCGEPPPCGAGAADPPERSRP